ncbi:MAG: alpha/beta hydrolase [Clostridia bacterium]|nr:alpha/beta hydrolase [Clostridia bacterium]
MKKEKEKKKISSLARVGRVVLIVLALYLFVSAAATAIAPAVLFGRCDGGTRFSLRYSDADAEAYPRTAFSFTSGGNTLRGYLYRPEDPKGLLVIVNGIKNGSDVHLPHIRAFYDDGWAVATYDATGVGESEGRGVRGLPQVRADLFAFLDCRESDPGLSGMKTVLFGHSAGAYAAACALGRDGISGAILISGFDKPSETMMYHARARVGVLADIEYPFMLLGNFIAFGPGSDEEAHEAIIRSETPVMIVGGDSDDTVPGDVSLMRYREEIGDGRAVFIEAGGERGEHSTPWLTKEAAEYVNSFEGEEPDRARANELDPDFLRLVLDFADSSIESR